MRKIATLKEKVDEIVRLMIYSDNEGAYLFGFKKNEDCSSEFDYWFESEEEAIESCKIEYGVSQSDWTIISNPKPYCQHDRIDPVRVKDREQGKPVFGQLEKLVDGEWIELKD